MKKTVMLEAMILRYHYCNTFFHSLEDLKNDPLFGAWWKGLDNYNRTYVLTGR